MKKSTIKDVAREAGVSVATVSYVINNKEGQKISPATKKKVLQIVNLLNYTPNSSAQNLSNNHNSYIAVHYPAINNYFQSLDVAFFIEKLSQALVLEKYNLVYIPSDANTAINQVAGIICFNETKDSFFNISESNLAPIIAVDCIVNNDLFYQLNFDFESLRVNADIYFKGEPSKLVCLNVHNELLKEKIYKSFPQVLFLNSYEDFVSIQKEPKQNIVLINPSLNELFAGNSATNHSVYFQTMHGDQKFSTIIALLQSAIKRVEKQNHDVMYS